jgi:hypothetical protein
MRSMARWVLPVLVGPRTATRDDWENRDIVRTTADQAQSCKGHGAKTDNTGQITAILHVSPHGDGLHGGLI